MTIYSELFFFFLGVPYRTLMIDVLGTVEFGPPVTVFCKAVQHSALSCAEGLGSITAYCPCRPYPKGPKDLLIMYLGYV